MIIQTGAGAIDISVGSRAPLWQRDYRSVGPECSTDFFVLGEVNQGGLEYGRAREKAEICI